MVCLLSTQEFAKLVAKFDEVCPQVNIHMQYCAYTCEGLITLSELLVLTEHESKNLLAGIQQMCK